MPRTVDEGFRDFLKKLTPSGTESAAAKKHRASIKARLERDFELKRFFRSGSFGNGTSVSGYSDVDYFASVPSKNLDTNSSVSLRAVRDSLADRFPRTSVRVDCPAVRVPFGLFGRESTEVVPADYVGRNSNKDHIYEIADCDGGWLRTSPDAHNRYVRTVDSALSRKVRPLVRFIKAWKFYRSVPISSFYLEMRVAKYAADEPSIVYSMDVERVLRLLERLELARLQDPTGISGYIAPCRTPTQHREAMSKLRTARARAEKARACEAADDISGAFAWWRLLYDEKFPSYYY